MHTRPQSDRSEKVILANNDHPSDLQNTSQPHIIQLLLNEVIRVRELIKHYDSLPEGGDKHSTVILNELVAEAYNSLVNYDIALMDKYYDLLQNCD